MKLYRHSWITKVVIGMVAAIGVSYCVLIGWRYLAKTWQVNDYPSDIFWRADHETGDLSQWLNVYGEAIFNSGLAEVDITHEVAHSGRYAIDLTIRDAHQQTQGARIFRLVPLPEEAYYSAWYYFPQRYQPAIWWNVFQFKSKVDGGESTSMWSLNVDNNDDGDMFFYLWDAIRGQSYEAAMLSPETIPVNQWVHLEVFYRRSTGKTGSVVVWQDGIKIYDVQDVQTALSDTLYWSVNNYTDDIEPSTATIFVDDAVISTVRISEGLADFEVD